MTIVLLKNMTHKINIIEQQKEILRYSTSHNISIDATEVETSNPSLQLEDRKELRGFLRSLESESTVMVYDFWTLSTKVGELVKIFDCLLKRNICLHLCHQDKIISVNTPVAEVLSFLVDLREANRNPNHETSQGRPKGRMSKSKFDIHRTRVIELLEEGASVSKIAKILSVSRSSLKDYINSRGLKELANTKKTLLDSPASIRPRKRVQEDKECDLINKEQINQLS